MAEQSRKDVWTYASATSITTPGDLSGTYWPGMRIALKQTTIKYFVVESVTYNAPNTTIVLDGLGVYSLANAAITAHIDTAATPRGFPYPNLPTQIKTAIKTYTDALYATVGHDHASVYAPIAKGVTGGDNHDHNGGDGAQIDHTTLSNKGTNSHSTIDSHLGNTSNPHGVTFAQAGAAATGGKTTSELQNNTTLESGIFDVLTLKAADGVTDYLLGWWHVLNMHHLGNNGYNSQIAVPLAQSGPSEDIYWRHALGGTWSEWRRLLSESTGNALYATVSHNHNSIYSAIGHAHDIYTLLTCDYRNDNPAPESYGIGIRSDFKNNNADGLADGGTFHGVLTFRQWTDWSGGGVRQLGFTDNHNLWIRGANADTTWSAWKKLVRDAGGVSGGQYLVGTTKLDALDVVGSATVGGMSYRKSVTFTPSGSGPKWIRLSFDGFNVGYTPIHIIVTRSILENSGTPFGGPTLELKCYGREWHSGEQFCTATYGYHGDTGAEITHAAIVDGTSLGYHVYLRLYGGVTYHFLYLNDCNIAAGDPEDNATGAPDVKDRYAIYTGFNVIGDYSPCIHVAGSAVVDGFQQGTNSGFRHYPNVVSFTSSDSLTGAFVVHTPMTRNCGDMFVIRVHGYFYGVSKRVDFTVVGYAYGGVNGNVDNQPGAPFAYSIVDHGNDGQPKLVGVDANGNIAAAIGSVGNSVYYPRLSVDFYSVRIPSLAYLSGWSIDVSNTSGFGWLDINTPATMRLVTGGDSHDHNGGDGAQVDHGGLAGLSDNDHAQYLLVADHKKMLMSVAPDGTIYALDSSQQLRKWNVGANSWDNLQGTCQAVSAVSSTTAYVLGGDFSVWKNVSGTWSQVTTAVP